MKGQRTVTPSSSKMMVGGNKTLPSDIRDAVYVRSISLKHSDLSKRSPRMRSSTSAISISRIKLTFTVNHYSTSCTLKWIRSNFRIVLPMMRASTRTRCAVWHSAGLDHRPTSCTIVIFKITPHFILLIPIRI